MSEFAENDQEDDEAGNPAVEFVHMHDLVAEECDDERASGNDDDTGESWHVSVDGVNQLRADNDIDSRPAEAGEAVKDGNCCVVRAALW